MTLSAPAPPRDRSRAKAQGQHMGRPALNSATAERGHPTVVRSGATLDELARSYNVGISTISQLPRQ